MLIEPLTLGIIGMCCLGVLVVIGMHVAYAGALVGLVGLVMSIGITRIIPGEGGYWDAFLAGFMDCYCYLIDFFYYPITVSVFSISLCSNGNWHCAFK